MTNYNHFRLFGAAELIEAQDGYSFNSVEQQCHYMILGADVAREMIEAGEYEDVVSKWGGQNTSVDGRRANSSSCGRKSRRLAVTRTRRSRTGDGSREWQLPVNKIRIVSLNEGDHARRHLER